MAHQNLPYLLSFLRFYLFDRERENEHKHEEEEQQQAEGEREVSSPLSKKPNMGLDPRTLGS